MSHYKPDPNKSVNLTVDGIPVTVPEGTRILEAAKKANVKIPTLCDCPGLGKRAACRLCVVECDGRGKLAAACANDVSEGLSVVTNNASITGIRKMIVELLLANHPQECLTCIRSKNCELQSLAADFGIRASPFRREAADRRPAKTEREILVWDMAKCVKCGRCVEVCQEHQTVRAINSSYRGLNYGTCTPYERALSDTPCIFCGNCAAVCPVGAIYEHDQSAEAWAAINDGAQHVAVQIAATMGTALERELGLAPGTVTGGRMAAALKRIGFDTVFDANYSVAAAVAEEGDELLYRIKNSRKLPLISGCAPPWSRFVKRFYPGLHEYLTVRSPQKIFGSLVKAHYPKRLGLDPSKITTVSVMPCIAFKYEALRGDTGKAGIRDVDMVLTTRELARMIQQAGIDFTGLPESPFDCLESSCFGDTGAKISSGALGGMEAVLRMRHEVYTGKDSGPNILMEPEAGIKEAEAELEGTKVKALIVSGLANARTVMESILSGECDAALVEVKSCAGCDASVSGSIKKAARS